MPDSDQSSIHAKIATHSEKLARQETAIQSLASTTEHLAETVGRLPQQIRAGLDKVYSRLDAHEQRTRPDVKWLLGSIGMGLSLLMAAFSIVLTLTVNPIRASLSEQEADYKSHLVEANKFSRDSSAAKATADARYEMALRWNSEQTENIERLRTESTRHGAELQKIQESQRHLERWLNDADNKGSRKWVPQTHGG